MLVYLNNKRVYKKITGLVTQGNKRWEPPQAQQPPHANECLLYLNLR